MDKLPDVACFFRPTQRVRLLSRAMYG
jgi:hypothetical protein